MINERIAVNGIEAVKQQARLLDQRESDLLTLQAELTEKIADGDGNDPEAENAYARLPGQFAALKVQRQRLEAELNEAKWRDCLEGYEAVLQTRKIARDTANKLLPEISATSNHLGDLQHEYNSRESEFRNANERAMYFITDYIGTHLDGDRAILTERANEIANLRASYD